MRLGFTKDAASFVCASQTQGKPPAQLLSTTSCQANFLQGDICRNTGVAERVAGTLEMLSTFTAEEGESISSGIRMD